MRFWNTVVWIGPYKTHRKKSNNKNYSIRKRLLQYDDVLNRRKREIVYSIRNDTLMEEDPSKILLELVEEELDARLAVIPLQNLRLEK